MNVFCCSRTDHESWFWDKHL